jgi:hypothetical protein
MFSKLFPARVRGVALALKRSKGNDEEEAVAIVTLQYDFTPDMAEAIGGAAPQLQEMLANGGEGVKVSRSGLVLDVAEVGVKMKGADKEELTIDRTSKLKAKARQPNAEDTGPTLEAALAFHLADDEPLAFLRAHLGQLVKVRMDRRQLELPAVSEEAAE